MSQFNIFNLIDIFYGWLAVLNELWTFFNTSVGYHLEPLMISYPPLVFVGGALKLLGLYNLTVLEFALGAGLTLYLGYQFFIWVLNLIT